jgi:phosphopantothenoylcysteine decarboxylase/phosphopantothenate--cysteine ligase
MPRKLRILISAGPTREPIDPVRYLSNFSSGKMGYALAQAAMQIGDVTLVTGPVALNPPRGCRVIPVLTAKEMLTAMTKEFKNADITIMVAAVADYRPAIVARQKIKKTKGTLTLKLIKNPDVLKTLGARKKANQILVGFAAETKNVLAYGKKKLREKNLDWIVINNVAKKGIGFGSDDNEIILVGRDEQILKMRKAAKTHVAELILAAILPLHL